MPAYIVTGTLGGGKTLACVGRIREYIERGLPVATNIDLELGALCPKRPPLAPVYRLPDKPTADDLYAIGAVHETGREELNGAVVLDECGTWLNAREWSDKGRQVFIEWALHSRKFGWDLYFIVQSPTLLDKQIREVFKEDYSVRCRRLDRVRVPYLGALVSAVSLGAIKLKLPAVHLGVVVYGHGHSAVIADRWMYKGKDLWGAYRTAQRIGPDSPGLHCLLHPGTPEERAARERLRARLASRKPKRPEVAHAMALPESERLEVLSRVWQAARAVPAPSVGAPAASLLRSPASSC